MARRLFLCIGIFVFLAVRPTPSQTSKQEKIADAIEAVRPAIVQVAIRITGISSPAPFPLGQSVQDCFQSHNGICVVGTGFFVNDSGDVITAGHVGNDVRQIIETLNAHEIHAIVLIGVSLPNFESNHLTVASGTQVFPATLTATNAEHDIAIFHTTDNPFTNMRPLIGGPGAAAYPPPTVTFLHLALTKPRDGDEIFACGFPFGEPGLVTTSGALASAWKSETLMTAQAAGLSDTTLTDTYWVDLRVNPGNSGGPIFRMRDHAVLGIVVEGKGSIGVVVPAKYVADFLKSRTIQWTPADNP
jgi:S1-C subfamily serine protease